MWELLQLLAEQVGILLIYIAIGYILRRSKILPESAGHTVSLLLTYIFSPAYIIVNISGNFRMEVLTEKLVILGYGVLLAVIIVVSGQLLGRLLGCSRSKVEKSSLIYAYTFSNFGYFGYPVLEGTFGTAFLADFLVFVIPTNLLCYSYGYVLFQDNKRFQPLRLLKTPMILGVIIGVVLGLSGLQLPGIAQSVLSGTAACMSPCAMLMVGFVMGKFSLKHLFSGVRPYLLVLIRMVGLPVVIGGLLWLCGMHGQLLYYFLVFLCMPLGMNLVVYPESLGFEKVAEENAKAGFISYVLSLVILPCVLSVASKLCM